MIELIQTAWSPFCLVQRQILEFSGEKFKVTNLPRSGDRSLIWKLTREKYYAVPVLRDGAKTIFESGEDTQDLARHLDKKFRLGLFPAEHEGVQAILCRHIENEIEAVGFKLNDIYFKKFVVSADRVAFIRHKERKFGRGCLERWRDEQPALLKQLEERLIPYEQMLLEKPFLLDARPRFVDFDLCGMLGNFLASGKYELPAAHTQIRAWYARITKARAADFPI